MFVVDFVAASVLAVVLTVGFAALFWRYRYRRLSDMSGPMWLLTVGSWLVGILIVGCGPYLTRTHWLPFAVAGFLVGLLLVTLANPPNFKALVFTERGAVGVEARPAIAVYFFVTLLLLFCAISLRFYIVNIA